MTIEKHWPVSRSNLSRTARVSWVSRCYESHFIARSLTNIGNTNGINAVYANVYSLINMRRRRRFLTWVYVIQQHGSTWSKLNWSNHIFAINTQYPLHRQITLPMLHIIQRFHNDHLIWIKTPVLKLLLKERSADIRWVVQLARSVVVQDLCKYTRMPWDVNL